MNNEPDSAPPVDIERLMEFSDGAPESLRGLVNLYVTQTRKQLDELGAAIAGRRTEDLRRVAHSCAGSSATCGMVTLAPLLQELEHLGQAGRLDGADGLLNQSEREFARIQEVLSRLLGPTPPPANHP